MYRIETNKKLVSEKPWYLIGRSRRCVREGRTEATTIRWQDDGDTSEKAGTIMTRMHSSATEGGWADEVEF